MTADGFRRSVLALPGAVESAHMNHPDFRVQGRIFATLGYPDAAWGMVHVTPEEQAELLALDDETYLSKGVWGQRGCTLVRLGTARAEVVRHALERAWQLAQTRQKPAKKRTAK